MGQPSVGKLFGEGMGMPSHAAQIILNQNAIVNPGAEQGSGSADSKEVTPILNEVADLRFLTS